MSERRLGWLLFAVGFAVLLLTEQPVGFVRDESQYFHAAESYGRWFQLLVSSPSQAMADETITRAFDINHEHPVLMKNLFGLSFIVLHEKLHLLRPAAAFRVPAFAIAALMLPLIYLLSRKRFGRTASLFAAVTWVLVPRQFFNSHLACFDVPIAALWLLTVYCFIEALEKPRWWLYTGLSFGAALATKHNGFFLPVVLVPFSVWVAWQRSAAKPAARRLFLAINGTFIFGLVLYGVMVAALGAPAFQSTFTFPSGQLVVFCAVLGVGATLLVNLKREDEGTFRAVAPLVAMAALGPVIFYLHWPYLWHHPVDRAVWYFNFHLTHNHYAWFYLGQLLRGPPFPLEYVLVKTALTVPTSIFVPMAFGVVWALVRLAKREMTVFEALVLANALLSIALISMPNVPHFGGVKHWFPSMPFLAILAAGSVERGGTALSKWLTERGFKFTEDRVLTAFSALLLVAPLIATERLYEFGTSAYSELAGGVPGAASLGMQRQFWANNLTGVLPWLNEHAQAGERVYLHENHGWQIQDYQRNGMLRSDLAFVGSPQEADLVVYQYHQEFREAEFQTWQTLGTKPVYGLYLDETPQIVVYRRQH